MSESAVVAACMQWLYLHGCMALRNNTGAFKSQYTRKDGSVGESWVRFGRKGWSDIIFCSPTGRYGEVEAKAAGGKQSPEQGRHQLEVEDRGGIYIVARSTDDLDARRSDILG